MRRILLAPIAALTLSSTLGAPLAAAGGDTKLHAKLVGSEETPANTIPATGMFAAHVDAATGKFCYKLTSHDLPSLTMAHVHIGQAGVAGPPAITLMADSPKQTCMTIDKDLARKLVDAPGDYYVNIHNAAYPKGAIRGQLMK